MFGQNTGGVIFNGLGEDPFHGEVGMAEMMLYSALAPQKG
jgi:hypothetical protein